MALIKEDSINKIRLRSGLVDVITDYVDLKKKGLNFFGCCPFHQEKTPSFSVNEDKNIYKCFGCGASGTSIFNFIMDIEKLTYPESIEFLAKRSGIELEYDKIYSSQSKNFNSEIIEIHQIATNLYLDNFKKNSTAKNYLNNRGFKDSILHKFQIGLSTNSYDQLLKTIQNQKKFSAKSMKQCGLFIETERGYIDKFRNRIMFPIHSHTGQIIAFTGRSVNTSDKAKYINSPETPIYKKGSLFYGLWETNKSIVDEQSVIIIEGQTDFLKLFQKGIKNIIATSGTAFTDNQAKLINRKTNKAYLLYDGDGAGKAAAKKAGYMLLKYGVETKIVEIPNSTNGKPMDPDDWADNEEIDSLKNKIYAGLDVIDFHLKYYSDIDIKNKDVNIGTDAGKAQFINDCLSSISEMENPVYKELQMKHLSSITNITGDSIKRLSDQLTDKKNKFSNLNKKIEKQAQTSSKLSLENDLIKLCFSKDRSIRTLISETFKSNWLTSKINVNIFNKVYIHLSSEEPIDGDFIVTNLETKDEKKHLIDLLFDINESMFSIKMAEECIFRLKQKFIKSKIENLRESLKINQNNTNYEDIISKITSLQKEMNETI